jgi:phosphopantothenoylcysteine decarboxylase/phosphopantothenate--cysteine ligase
MHCVITAGPTYETMDNVRRLTNFSTGRLGIDLGNFLFERGHQVTLLVGEQATHCGDRKAQRVEMFTTSANLLEKFRALSTQKVDAVFHAAAVSDYTFGKIWLRSPAGELTEIKAGKISTRAGTLMAELVPTPKIIAELRGLFPKAKIVGWKYEVDGDRASVLAAAERQLSECHTDACVTNGPAFGLGFGLVTGAGECPAMRDPVTLFAALEKFVRD